MFFKLIHHVGFQTPLLAQIAANQKFFGLTSSLKPEALITWLGLFVSHTKASVLIVDSVSFSSSLCLTILPSSSGTLGNSHPICPQMQGPQPPPHLALLPVATAPDHIFHVVKPSASFPPARQSQGLPPPNPYRAPSLLFKIYASKKLPRAPYRAVGNFLG